ncbi:unnamed protein product [Adineta steineri]|uniref:RNA-dependent RNA polymerase n=1 Tax=Adineta steineri TaxID=433720 RepID=A0A814PT80_9BILA|nr:unnamed protein product [Adineta steineri]
MEYEHNYPNFLYKKNQCSPCEINFIKYNRSICVYIKQKKFELKSEHIDIDRGVDVDEKSIDAFLVYIYLKGNPDEYELQKQANGYTRRLYLPNIRGKECEPCLSTIRLSIFSKNNTTNTIRQVLQHFIQYFKDHSIPIRDSSIKFLENKFIYRNNSSIHLNTFMKQYALQMFLSVGCRIYDQMINNNRMKKYIYELSNRNDDNLFYYVLERLRRFAVMSENYYSDFSIMIPDIIKKYEVFYLNSTFYRVDRSWTNYVRIPWFCFTPTRCIIKPYKFMRSNRVFRHMSDVSRCMAFVEFRDDTGSAFLPKELAPLLEYYLRNGFQFANRHYIYLHHAQSQIRNKQFYFYCEEEGGMTREELENWMGNFDDEKLPAKNTARRTQPFSSTEDTIEIDKELVETIPDVKTSDGKYNFTDGVGQISSELNLKVHEAIGVDVDNDGYVSSVLQIRYGGCKGTIAVNPLLDGQDKQLLIRPSMNKFKCDHQRLELCKRSLRRHLRLNRQVIDLLSYRGISSECLLVCQLRNILWLIKSLTSNESALSVLRQKVIRVLPWPEISYHSCLSKEPFFRRLLHKTISNNLQQLVTKAHINIPKARYMFGIVDEHKVLHQGQVFVQITDEDGTRTVLKGPIVITKNPCHHPGDLLVLEAVDISSLYHLYDVLVFPQQGTRPHASEISGSDLDGDEYTVIWDPELIPTTPNPSSHNYDSGPAPKPLERAVNRNDRLKVIMDICEQDNLGRLSTIHLVLVDKFGINSHQAVMLAAGISQELDSVKSGQHPYTPEKIKKIISKAGKTRPDFMQSTNYKPYKSKKILGILFRSAHHLTDTFSNANFDKNDLVLIDLALLHENFEKYIDFAQDLYRIYTYEMLEIMGAYGFSNEIDLFCCAESCNMDANERSDIQHTVQQLLKAVFCDIRNIFFNDAMSASEAKAKAAACYCVAYTDDNDTDERMLSFPWLFASQLLPDCPNNLEDEDEPILDYNSTIANWLKLYIPSLLNLIPNKDDLTFTEILEILFQKACDNRDKKMIDHAEKLIEQLIKITANTY